VGCLLSPVTLSFAVQETVSLMQSCLLILSLRWWALGVLQEVIPYIYLFQCISYHFL
jgi:hypothetical protein